MPLAADETGQEIFEPLFREDPWDSRVNQVPFSPAEIPERTDADIARTVRLSLEWDPFLPDQNIRSTVCEGWVSLEGDVSTPREKEDAEKVVRVLVGVQGVHNLLTVTAPAVDQRQLRERIEEALELEAEREAEKISVNVEGDTVTLEGRLRTWMEKNSVLGTVSHAPGVREVKDRLSVDPWN
jgi:osmotically-inducible protein OsmY